MPHPLDHYFILKVQTTPDTTPQHVLGNAVTELIQNVGSMKNKFEVRRRKEKSQRLGASWPPISILLQLHTVSWSTRQIPRGNNSPFFFYGNMHGIDGPDSRTVGQLETGHGRGRGSVIPG